MEHIIDIGAVVNTVTDGDARYREYTVNDAQLEALLVMVLEDAIKEIGKGETPKEMYEKAVWEYGHRWKWTNWGLQDAANIIRRKFIESVN